MRPLNFNVIFNAWKNTLKIKLNSSFCPKDLWKIIYLIGYFKK